MLDLIFGTVLNLFIETFLDLVIPLDHFHPALTITLHTQISILCLDNIHTFYDFHNVNQDVIFFLIYYPSIGNLLYLYMILIPL